MIPESYWLDEYEEEANSYLIDGLLSPYLTTLSGQPKVGKSTFATQLVKAVINNKSVLDRGIHTEKRKAAWLGYDAGFVGELKSRLSPLEFKSVLVQNPIMSLKVEDWDELGKRLVDNQIAFIVIDHLYGLGGHLNLNENQEARKVTKCFDVLTINHSIPVLLIAQATKNASYGGGGMAHSNLFKSSARLLLEMTGSGDRKTLKTIGNEIPLETLKFNLSPTEIDSVETIDRKRKQDRDFEENLQRARRVFENATPEELKNGNSMAPVLLRISASKSVEGSVKMAYRLLDKGLMKQTDTGLVPGENYFLN